MQEQFDIGHDEGVSDRLNNVKSELENIRKHELNGVILRAGARWIEEGEKPTKYFCNLEKRNYVNKTVSKLINHNGNDITEQKQILNEIKHFYDDLYKSRDNILEEANLQEILKDYEIPVLSNEERNNLDKAITKCEVLEVLKKTKNNKSPGTDGFSAEFFKFFWIDIGDFIFRSFRDTFVKGKLSESQKLGIISILPKGNKPREYLKNWRPISLLNVTYKILSGVIASRIKSVLSNVIHENQKGFIAGRYIGENTRLLYDIIHNCNKLDIPGIILMIDFEKAFDTVSWKFIRDVLKYYNFGEYIRKWIDIFFNDFKLCVIQNGMYSEFFNIGRGCRQGDPVSPYIFLFCVEIMGAIIRKNKDIKGIYIRNREYKLLQYADDTAILLDGSEKSLRNTLSLIEQFSKFSGLKPNFQKTSCIKIGSLRDSEHVEQFCTDYNLTWTHEPFVFLGIKFSASLLNIIEMNFNSKLEEIKKLIISWNRRLLSTAGKITVVKSVLLPKLTHLFISLPNPSQIMIKELEKLFFNFIWNGKNDRICRKTLIQDFSNGGMRMICLSSFIKSLKITWVRRIFTCDENVSWFKLLIDTLPNVFKSYQILGNFLFMYVAEKITNPFWQDVFKSFYEFRNITDIDDPIVFHSVWFNEKIKIGRKPICYREWTEKGINYIHDFFGHNGKILEFDNFCQKFDFIPAFTSFYGIVSCIKKLCREIDIEFLKKNQPFRQKFIQVLLKHEKGTTDFYDLFIQSKYDKPKSQLKWERELDFYPGHIWWNRQNTLVRVLTNDISLRWFHYRILNRIIGNNVLLSKMGVIDSDACTFCRSHPETIVHLFYACSVTSDFWNDVFNWINSINDTITDYNIFDILFGKLGNSNRALNLIICLAKRYLYNQKMKKCVPHLAGAMQYIKCYIKTDQYICKKNCNSELFVKKWRNFISLVDDE